jgi:hypothetical protein
MKKHERIWRKQRAVRGVREALDREREDRLARARGRVSWEAESSTTRPLGEKPGPGDPALVNYQT